MTACVSTLEQNADPVKDDKKGEKVGSDMGTQTEARNWNKMPADSMSVVDRVRHATQAI